MGKKDRPKKNRYRAVIAIVIAGIVFLTFPRAEERNFRELLMEDAELELLNALCPVIAAAGDNGCHERGVACKNAKLAFGAAHGKAQGGTRESITVGG